MSGLNSARIANRQSAIGNRQLAMPYLQRPSIQKYPRPCRPQWPGTQIARGCGLGLQRPPTHIQRPCHDQYPGTQKYPGPGDAIITSDCGAGGASLTTTAPLGGGGAGSTHPLENSIITDARTELRRRDFFITDNIDAQGPRVLHMPYPLKLSCNSFFWCS